MKEKNVTGVVPTISSTQSAILDGAAFPEIDLNPMHPTAGTADAAADNTFLSEHTASTDKALSEHTANADLHARGLPSPQRMAHWSTKGQMMQSPLSQLTDGTRSLLEHNLEQHIEFRRRQSLRMEQHMEQKLMDVKIEQMLDSVKNSSQCNSVLSTTAGSSVSSSYSTTSQTTSTLSHPSGSMVRQKKNLQSAFRPKSAAAVARKRVETFHEYRKPSNLNSTNGVSDFTGNYYAQDMEEDEEDEDDQLLQQQQSIIHKRQREELNFQQKAFDAGLRAKKNGSVARR